MVILASAMLAGSLLASDAQARGGGGGGHMGGGGGHIGGGFGRHMGSLGGLGGSAGLMSGLGGSHVRTGTRTGSLGLGQRHHMARRYGGGRYGYGGGLYDDDGLCSNFDHMHHRWLPSCS
jgi:hypothetical protein